jgi:hypothetical protein
LLPALWVLLMVGLALAISVGGGGLVHPRDVASGFFYVTNIVGSIDPIRG